MDASFESFEDVERRLQAIVEEVSGDIPLDEALQLYEEAAQLGRLACTMSEQDIERAYPLDEPEGAEVGPDQGDEVPEAAGSQAAASQDAAEGGAAPGDEGASAPATA